MDRLLVVSALILVGVGCTSGLESAGRPSQVPANSGPPPGAVTVDGGCGSTPLFKGPVPVWVDQATHDSTPRGRPYVLDATGTVIGFLFAPPLRSGHHPENPINKILWAVRLPHGRADLVLAGHPLGSAGPSVRQTESTQGSQDAYRTVVDIPEAGCWHFELSWAGHRAAVDLAYT